MNTTYRVTFKLISIFLLLVQMLAITQPLQAAGECTVGEGYTTIQAAVEDTACSSIRVPNGTYNENIFVVRSLSIIGAGADVTIVEASGAGSVFFIMEDVTVSLSGLTISGGTGSEMGDGNTYGGGILNGGKLTVVDSLITNNRAAVGGGILSAEGSLEVVDSTIADNHAEGFGGGIAVFNGEVMVQNSTIRDNSAELGGGIVAYRSKVNVSNSVIRSNRAATLGGGLYMETEYQQTGEALIEQSTIHGNSAESAGGIFARFGTLEVDQSTISTNRATDAGGGIYAEMGNVAVIRSTLSGNEARQGGAIHLYFTRIVYIGYNTISENRAEEGGGLFANIAMYELSYNILSQNIGGTCGGDASGIVGGHNLVEDDSCTGVKGIRGDPLLGPLADNGGPTQTHALLPGSPALDAIPMGADGCNDADRSDQRGVTRPQGAGCDIGAYEAELSTIEVTVVPVVSESDPKGVSLYGVLVRAVLSIVLRQWELPAW
ncbi:hypothetical protein GC175_27995 [bacterium]|nr:hypothetical protein [bacterium]